MKTLLSYLILLILSVPALAQGQEKGLQSLDFFIGEWNLVTIDKQADGTIRKGRAKSSAKYILDGTAVQDNFLQLDQNGKVVFRGTSIRSYNRRTGKFQIVWIMPGIKGLTDISAEWKGDKFVSTGKGYDPSGEFLERFEYYNITEDSYSFRMDRSYDGGKTWIENFGRIEAKKVK